MRIGVAIAVACMSLIGVSLGAEATASIKKATDIQEQSLDSALQLLAKDRSLQMIYPYQLIGERRTSGARGDLTLDEVMTTLLDGTGLAYRFIDDKTVTIVPIAAAPVSEKAAGLKPTAAVSTFKEKSFWDRFRLAQANPRSSDVNERTASDTETSPKLEEIIVTARKREERLQDVPLSLAVIGNQDIERRGLIGMEDYLRSIPGVNEIDNGPLNNSIVMRGISVSPEFENSNSGPTVGTYFGEAPITGAGGIAAGGIDVRPVDIERIEVLRGPQGTTYGSSSLGGTLRIIPAKPALEAFAARVSATYGDTSGFGSDNSMVQGMINIPLVQDRFALRAVGYRYEDSGYYRNNPNTDLLLLQIANSGGIGAQARSFTGHDLGHTVTKGGRLAALWRPSEGLELSANFLTQRIEQDGEPVASTGRYEQARIPVAANALVRGQLAGNADTNIDLANLTLNYDLGWGALTTAVSWADSGSASSSSSLTQVFGFPVSSTPRSDFKSLTSEARIASKLPGPFQFLAGLYYETIDSDYVQTYDIIGGSGTPLYLITDSQDLEQRAVFGEFSYQLTQTLTATVGGRYFKYDRGDRNLFDVAPFGSAVPVVLKSDDNGSNFKANLSYKPTTDSLLYASWSQGFRLGYPSPGVVAPLCDVAPQDGVIDGTSVTVESTRKVDADSLDNYEAGGKFALLDRRILLDATIYHIDWSGLPIRVASGTSCGWTANAGSATSDGVELQATLMMREGLKVDLGGGYTRARIAEDQPAQGWHRGDRLPGTPKLNANLSIQYDFDALAHHAFVRMDSLYTGKFYGDPAQTANTASGDYVKIDARTGVMLQHLGVELYVRNLTNEDAFTWRGMLDRGNFFGYRLRPRTVGVQLTYNF